MKQICLHKKKGAPTRPRCTTGVVPFPSQSPSFPYTSPTKPSQSPSFPFSSTDEHPPNPKPTFQIPFRLHIMTYAMIWHDMLNVHPASKKIFGRGRQNGTAFDMLPWQMHQGPPIPMDCRSTAVPWGRRSLAKNVPLQKMFHRKGDKPFACAYMFIACVRHARACPSYAPALHLPALALPIPACKLCLRAVAMLPLFAGRAASAGALAPALLCSALLCFATRFESLPSCVRSARWVYTGAPTHVGTCVPLLCDI